MSPRYAAKREVEVVVAVLCLLVFPSILCGQQLPIKTYTAADGLAQNLVLKIVRDSSGYLWFCTAEGLSRFDGYSFKNYTQEHGLPHRSVRDLLETRGAVYWMATGDGLVRFDPAARKSSQSSASIFTVYHPGQNSLNRSIRRIYEDREGIVWLGTDGGVYRLVQDVNEIKIVSVEMGMPEACLIQDIQQDNQGSLWFGTRTHGLYRRLPNGTVEHYGMKNGLPDERANALLQDKQGRFWVGMSSGLCLLKENVKANEQIVSRVYKKASFGIESEWVETLFETSDGRLWVGLSGGLSESLPHHDATEQKFQSYATAQGLQYLDLTSLMEDASGNLWIGATGGAMKLARNGFITYSEIHGIKPFRVQDIVETPTGEICIIAGAHSHPLFILTQTEKGFSIVHPNFPKSIRYFGWGWNQTALVDRNGEWWIATGNGVCRFPKVERVAQLAFTPPKGVYTKKSGLLSDFAWRIFEDSRGDVWLAAVEPNSVGITRWERSTETFQRYTSANGLPPAGWAAAFAEDKAGNVWIGIGGTLVRYAQGRFKSFTVTDGLSASGINALHVDASNQLWIASDTVGLIRVDTLDADHLKFANYTTADGLSSNQVWASISDQEGIVYAFTGRGLDQLDFSTRKVRHYTSADGLVGGAPKTALRDSHGTLWFGSDLGLSRLIPQVDLPKPALPIWISGLRVGGDPKPLSELGESEVPEIRLSPNENQIQIDYVGLNFGVGEELKYQFKLEGADKDWNIPTLQRSVNFARLSPGSYRFAVRAVGSDGSTSEVPAYVAFVILPPFWQRWWFVLTVSMTVAFIAYAAYRYRLARVLEIERVRMRIATDLHDDIGSNLSLIAMVSEVANRGMPSKDSEVSGWLKLIANTSRETVDSMSDIVWAINPSKDRLFDLTQRMRRLADDILSAQNIKLKFTAPDRQAEKYLAADTRREVFMIFKEALNNAVRHSRCTTVEVELFAKDGYLQFNLKDDGTGFDVGKASQGNGLASIRKRAQHLRADLSISSEIGGGTLISLRIVIEAAPWRRPSSIFKSSSN
jgi:ligand-binding sensor domain-containing protein/two-component sensor histidine kinase